MIGCDNSEPGRAIRGCQHCHYIGSEMTKRIFVAVVGALLILAGCGRTNDVQPNPSESRDAEITATPSIQMGGIKSVTIFFITSRGAGKGGDLGGLAGADAHCQSLAKTEGSGDHTWRAYLSATATPTEQAVNARDRIGRG